MSAFLPKCRHCSSTEVSRNGHTRNGKQRYWCKACKRSSRSQPEPNNGGYSLERKQVVLAAYYERPSLRRISREFGISRVTLIKWRRQGLGF